MAEGKSILSGDMTEETSDKRSKLKGKKDLMKEKLAASKNRLTESEYFKKFVNSTFSSIDVDGKGEITKDELYQGLLLLHLKLAKFAGAAACYPPEKSTCDELFDAADHDNSGGVDKEEFVNIMAICCAQILSRMIMYYLILILYVPYASAKLVDMIFFIPNGSVLETAFESLVGFAMFYLAIPVAWNYIDAASKSTLEKNPPAKKPVEKKED